MNENVTKLDAGDDKSGEYKVDAICNSAVYVRKPADYLPKFYYLVSCKDYLKEENIWELYSAVQYLRKLISLFHKDHPDKLIAIFEAINTAPPIARLTIKLAANSALKQKQGHLSGNSFYKQAKKN